jgi:hypothetical protein
MKGKKRIFYLAFIILIITGSVILLGDKYNKSQLDKKIKEQSSAGEKKQSQTKVFFVTDGKNSVYKIRKEDKWAVIWNGQEGKLYDAVSNPIFSSDGNNLAYVAQNGNQYYVVVNNNQEINAYQGVTYLTFNSTGNQIAFVSSKNQAYVVITSDITNGDAAVAANTTESQEYQSVVPASSSDGDSVSIIYSPNGEDVVYVVEENGETYVVVNGEAGTKYDDIVEVYYNEEGQLVYVAREGDAEITVINNEVVPAADTSENQSSENLPSGETGTGTNSGNNTGSSGSSSKRYRYSPSTSKDIVRDSDDSDSSVCTGDNCNF